MLLPGSPATTLCNDLDGRINLTGNSAWRAPPFRFTHGRTQALHKRCATGRPCLSAEGVSKLRATGNGQGQDNNALPPSGSSLSSKESSTGNSAIRETDAAFLVKLLIISLAGSVLVKYGSLFIDVPFQPSLDTAIFIIITPCSWFAMFLFAVSKSEKSGTR